MNYAIADLFIDDWDDDWGGTSYNNSNSSPEEQEIIYDNYADFAKDFDYGFVISDGELRAGKQRFKSTYLVCMDPNGDRGIRDENCNVYCKGTLYPFFNEIDQYEVPEGVKKIGTGAFSDYVKLCSVTITDGVTTIEKEAFKNCRSLTSITIPNSVMNVGTGAFWGCSQARVTIPRRLNSAVMDSGMVRNIKFSD